MPLAHPTTATTTQNYGGEMVVITFMTSDPGEQFADFRHRVDDPRTIQWGIRGRRERRTELIFDQASAARLMELLADYVTEA
jgi:hypothetical protein